MSEIKTRTIESYKIYQSMKEAVTYLYQLKHANNSLYFKIYKILLSQIKGM